MGTSTKHGGMQKSTISTKINEVKLPHLQYAICVLFNCDDKGRWIPACAGIT
jgi:hypothetical protein